MKQYQNVEVKIVLFAANDAITTSQPIPAAENEDIWGDFYS